MPSATVAVYAVGEIREQTVDAEVLGTLLAKQDSAFDDVKKELAGAVAKIHATLDRDQRERLARLLERMGPAARWA